MRGPCLKNKNKKPFDYTATNIDGTPNGKICEQTTFYPTDVVMVDSTGIALYLVYRMIWDDTSSKSREVGDFNCSQILFQGYLISPSFNNSIHYYYFCSQFSPLGIPSICVAVKSKIQLNIFHSKTHNLVSKLWCLKSL
jgi:hypothetical protein